MKNKDMEKQRIDNIASKSLYASGASSISIDYSFEILTRYIKGEILEMGPAEGIMTDKIVNFVDKFTVVEGSKLFADKIKEKYPQLEVYCSLFEDFNTDKKFDTIIMGHVLEHVEDPVKILTNAKNYLKDDGIIFAAVSNSNSIHRQVALEMGLIEKLNSQSILDIKHGHRRCYNRDEFKRDFIKAGFEIEACGGYWLKPLSNKQIEETWSIDMLNAFMKLGEKYPDIAGEIYLVAGKK